jgi:hypothetical protein
LSPRADHVPHGTWEAEGSIKKTIAEGDPTILIFRFYLYALFIPPNLKTHQSLSLKIPIHQEATYNLSKVTIVFKVIL